ncbi:hypothetical protein P7K49_028409 [Saguinus oedipus]|uniref:Uncharacterized protein n=1 Tax=Saguinus oedipus TaxID=9490 RepID=A0ABQ9UCL9_SAGOE|nr:hypothetical protein P7K49_028409 [Saguinus oedipus]
MSRSSHEGPDELLIKSMKKQPPECSQMTDAKHTLHALQHEDPQGQTMDNLNDSMNHQQPAELPGQEIATRSRQRQEWNRLRILETRDGVSWESTDKDAYCLDLVQRLRKVYENVNCACQTCDHYKKMAQDLAQESKKDTSSFHREIFREKMTQKGWVTAVSTERVLQALWKKMTAEDRGRLISRPNSSLFGVMLWLLESCPQASGAWKCRGNHGLQGSPEGRRVTM